MTVGGPAFSTVSVAQERTVGRRSRGGRKGWSPITATPTQEKDRIVQEVLRATGHNNIPGLEHGTFQMQSKMDSHKSKRSRAHLSLLAVPFPCLEQLHMSGG